MFRGSLVSPLFQITVSQITVSQIIEVIRMRFLPVALLSLLCALTNPINSNAAPTERGFQLPLSAITAESVEELATTWKVNVLRAQVGNNTSMDGTTGAAYDSMMAEQFALLDAKLPLLAAKGLKIILCLYSPPGGFETRQAPSHYLMFSQPSLQDDFIKIWQTIATRYGSNPAVAAFDLANEPAQRKGMLAAGAKNWQTLATDTIAAIRAIQPTMPIIVRSLYGDPAKLTQLNISSDPNISYSYNSYFYSKYQGQGDVSPPFSVARPKDDAILKSLRRRLAPFFFKVWTQVDKKALPSSAYPPKMVVGEAAVSACAPEAGAFFNGLLGALETDQSAAGVSARAKILRKWRAARKRNKRLPKPTFTRENFELDVAHTGYAIHSFGEEGARIWDPRYSCSSNGEFELSPTETDRSIVLKQFFAKN
jgi:hypothetical protein